MIPPRLLALVLVLGSVTRADELTRAREHLAAGAAREALIAIDDALEAGGGDAALWQLRAAAHEALGDLGAAIEDLGERVRLEPGRAEAWLARAQLRARKGDAGGALEDVEHARARGANDATTIALQASLLLEKGRARDAVRVLSVARDPEHARLLARARACAGDLAGAIATLDRRLEREPQDARARFDRLRLRALKGDLAGAREDAERAGADPAELAVWSVLLGEDRSRVAIWFDDSDPWRSARARWIAAGRPSDALVRLAARAPDALRRARLREAHLLRAIALRTPDGSPDREALEAALALGLLEP